jgi:hypothetical protein
MSRAAAVESARQNALLGVVVGLALSGNPGKADKVFKRWQKRYLATGQFVNKAKYSREDVENDASLTPHEKEEKIREV